MRAPTRREVAESGILVCGLRDRKQWRRQEQLQNAEKFPALPFAIHLDRRRVPTDRWQWIAEREGAELRASHKRWWRTLCRSAQRFRHRKGWQRVDWNFLQAPAWERCSRCSPNFGGHNKRSFEKKEERFLAS